MNKKLGVWLATVAVATACTEQPVTKSVVDSAFVPEEYQLIWNDEFDSAHRCLPDASKWNYEVGGRGWGNAELQYYVPAVYKTDTVAYLDGGVLHIKAVMPSEPVEGYKYLSARMNTTQSWTYGYFEARMKLPEGVGTWPAFWMLPEKFTDWPLDGEIDIMEHVGSHPDSIHISTHTQRYNHGIGTQQTSVTVIDKAQDEFHVYGLEWTPQEIKGYIDGVLRFRFQNDGTGQKETWPFDVPFYVKLNQAVGGGMGGVKGVDDTCFPATFQIDYVRVYQKNSAPSGIVIKKSADSFKLYVDSIDTYIKGVGGTYRLDVAAANGANAFRTWGGEVETVRKDLVLAAENKMYVMQGIAMTKDSALYHDDAYKDKLRSEVRLLAETFKNDTCLLAWGIGNEIDLGHANIGAAWSFVEELAQIIKSIDKRHLVSTVIAHNPAALDSIAKYAPTLDYVGINTYGPIGEIKEMVDNSAYRGAFMVTEWGPTGWWETASTDWKAPIEQTSEEKRQVYETRYTRYILANPRCLGSFVFLWGQKEERTPTWFSMFVEDNVEQLPLRGEKTPMVEAMQRVWTGKELTETAPVVEHMTMNGMYAVHSVRVKAGTVLKAHVAVTDKENDALTYVWELLKEATALGFGGSFEPRPERVGEVKTSDTATYETVVDTPGEYRLYVYVLDNTGFVSTVNVPFQVYK